jgi:hypothetical protein
MSPQLKAALAADPLVNAEEAAEILGCCHGSVRRWGRQGQLKPAIGWGYKATRYWQLSDVRLFAHQFRIHQRSKGNQHDVRTFEEEQSVIDHIFQQREQNEKGGSIAA